MAGWSSPLGRRRSRQTEPMSAPEQFVTRTVASGIRFGEGPRWHDGQLWFSDFFDHAIKTLEPDGSLTVRHELDDRPSGLGWMPDGSLIAVAMTSRSVRRIAPDGTQSLHADLGHIATFHCNDMVVDHLGRAYVGNFGFDLDAAITGGDFAGELARYSGANLALVHPDGSTQVVATGLLFPNGMVIADDTLIVAESLGRRLTAFTISDDGSLSNQRTWAELGSAVPDGIALADDGQVWLADAGGPRCIRVREGGEVTAIATTSQPCYACALDGGRLYALTAASSLAVEASVSRTGRVEVADL